MEDSTSEEPTKWAMARPETSPLVRRQRVFLVLISVVAVLATAGLIASLFIKSPAQKAAEASPPPASVLTAAVKREVLTQSVVVRGTVASSAQISITGKLGRTSSPAVLTKLMVGAGATVNEGQQLAEISGEPLFAFQGVVPAYRDIAVGVQGDDAAQLEIALQRLGYLSTVGEDKKFTWRASWALRELMEDRGYEAVKDADGYAMLPLHQYAFLPTTPATVAAVNGAPGDDISGAEKPLLSITTGDLRVSATIPRGSEEGITVDQEVEIADDVAGRNAKGKVASLGEFTNDAKSDSDSQSASNSQSAPGYPLTIIPTDGISSDWLGKDVKLTIVVEQTPQPELIVPVSAIKTTENGSSFVTKVSRDRARTQVSVTVGLTSGGNAAVTLRDETSLHEGDNVLVG